MQSQTKSYQRNFEMTFLLALLINKANTSIKKKAAGADNKLKIKIKQPHHNLFVCLEDTRIIL